MLRRLAPFGEALDSERSAVLTRRPVQRKRNPRPALCGAHSLMLQCYKSIRVALSLAVRELKSSPWATAGGKGPEMPPTHR